MKINKITNIVICYANEDEVVCYAYQLCKQKCDVEIELIVVVNKTRYGKDYLESKLRETGIEFNIVCPKENLGYLNGLLYGYSHSKKDSVWYIFSNTDIEIPSPFFMKYFIKKKYLTNNEIWAVGPSVFAPNKQEYTNPYLKQRPKKRTYIYRNVGMTFPHIYNVLFKIKCKFKKYKKQSNKKDSSKVYAIHGSYMFLRNELVSVINAMGAWELLYDEEQYIAEIVRNNNKKILYDSEIEILHMEGTSTGKVSIVPRYKKMKTANKRILREFY